MVALLQKNYNVDLMNVSSFCNAYLHIECTPEAKLKEFCFCSLKKCHRKTVTCTVRLQDDQENDILVKYFTNIYDREKKMMIHAEELAINDEAILSSIPHCKNVIFYLTYNPCHFSGGHNGSCNQRSCTLSLLQFQKKIAKCYFEIVISYTYRAHWMTQRCGCNLDVAAGKYKPNILKSQEGIHLLFQRGIEMRSFHERDYDFLKCVMHSQMLTFYKMHRNHILQYRKKMDAFVQSVLDKYKYGSQQLWTCQICSTLTSESSCKPLLQCEVCQ